MTPDPRPAGAASTSASGGNSARPTVDVEAIAPALNGIPLIGSALIPEGELVRLNWPRPAILFHSRMSRRQRRRRGHGRPRNAPRRIEVRLVRYQPELDRLQAAIG